MEQIDTINPDTQADTEHAIKLITDMAEIATELEKLIPDTAKAHATQTARLAHDYFPETECDTVPSGYQVIIQLPTLPEKIGSILMVSDTKDNLENSTCFGKVVEVGATAFKDRDTGQPWHEGPWAAVGDIVRVVRNTGQQWTSATEKGVRFVELPDRAILGKVKPHMLATVLNKLL